MTVIHLIRHSPSSANVYQDDSFDVPIVEEGYEMAKKITGDYDIVICSIMRRTRQTLLASNLTYDVVLYTPLCREFMEGNKQNMLEYETDFTPETRENFSKRIEKFRLLIKTLLPVYPKMAVIGHAGFFNELRGVNEWIYNCETVKYDIY